MSSSIFLIFLVTASISFVGSLQIGIVNAAVINAALYQNKKAAQYTALGGSLPEMIYASIAVFAFSLIQHQPSILNILNVLAAPTFLLFGIYFLRKKSVALDLKKETEKSSFWRGFIYGCINPQLLPFWFGTLIYLNSFETMRLITLNHKIAFILATSTGALVLLFSITYIVVRKKDFFLASLRKINFNKILGYMFIVLSFVKLIQYV